MILTGGQIQQEVVKGNIIIDPFQPELLNPNSYNYRLGKQLLMLTDSVIDAVSLPSITQIDIPNEGFILEPGFVYLGSTHEIIGSDVYVPSLIGRSSLGRLGLFLQITADLGHIGTNHCWTLELTCVQPLVIYAGMRIGQVSFWQPVGLDLLIGQKYIQNELSYSKYSSPMPSMPEKLIGLD